MKRWGICLALFLTACGGGGGEPTDPASEVTVAGTYTLATINGANLPFTSGSGVDAFRVVSGSLVMGAPSAVSTFTMRVGIQQPPGSTTRTVECSGNYTQATSTVTFNETSTGPDCGGQYTGSWNGRDEVTVNFDNSLKAGFRR